MPITEETPVRDRGEFFLLPLGGTGEQGSHKGYGLAVMSEILARHSRWVAGRNERARAPLWQRNLLYCLQHRGVHGSGTVQDAMDQMLETLRTTKPAPGHDRVLYPGLSEYEEMQDRKANGIPLHKEVIDWFDDITAELSLPRLERV